MFVLDIDLETLKRRLAERGEDEWGGRAAKRNLIICLHATKEDILEHGVTIDATAPIDHVVDEILRRCK